MNGRSSKRSWIAAGLCAGALLGGGLAFGALGGEPAGEFSVILGEMRNAVAHTAEIRATADRGGDPIKSRCAYESLRGMMQAVASTEKAQTDWETATAHGDEAGAKAQLLKAQGALELVRRIRNEGDNCIGRELAREGGTGTPGTTTVTVETTVRDDDPHAGPVESWAVRPPRLEIPADATAASPFRPAP